ncbi:unnamed protein product [marine sediment metagenome]|uniref:Uncharacterized protein n=1 Tax=marine sediment metagenome TaxID=412755 RepID=X1LHU9_9ZZZZ
MAAESGDVAYTGYGLTPRSLMIVTQFNTEGSHGISAPDLAALCLWVDDNNLVNSAAYLIYAFFGVGAYQRAIVKSYDADGFTLTWTKGSNPTGTANFYVVALG